MGKRALLAFFLSLLVITAYNRYMAKQYPSPSPQAPSQLDEKAAPFPTSLPRQPENQRILTAQAALQPSITGQGTIVVKDVVVETDLVRVILTSSGARIKSCQLKRYPEERLDARDVQNRLREIEQGLTQASAKTKESLQREQAKSEALLKKIEQNSGMAELISLAATVEADFSPQVILPNEERLSLILNTALYQCAQKKLILDSEQENGQLKFVYRDAQGWAITKTYSFSNSCYDIGLSINFANWDASGLLPEHFHLTIGPDVGMPQAQRGRRTYGYEGPVTYFLRAPNGWILKEKYDRKEGSILVQREHSEQVGWSGLENKYFLAALIPAQSTPSVIVEKNQFGEQRIALKTPWKTQGQYSFKIYLGPKQEEPLKAVGVNLEKAIDYGFFSPIARLIYQILVFFSRWTHNFGWAIVLLCIATKVIFYPLTHKSFESMQKMQQQMKSIQPEMNALREKFKDSPTKANKEIMELYRKRGVNPLASCQSGCLPLLLQMPVFFALYAVLYNSIELRGTPFLGWIADLSAKDPLYILPILMGISMFVQQKLTGMGTASGAQQDQAKMMAVLMPIFLTWIFASLPSGVVLYWLTFNILTSLQQLLIRKKQQVVTA